MSDAKKSVVIVLGQQLRDESLHSELRGRVDVGIELLRKVDAEYLVCSGGRTNPEIPIAESEAMFAYAVEQSLEPSQVIVEDQSAGTIGNGYFTRRVVEDFDGISTVYVVSTCYHMERVKYVFEQCYGEDYEINTDHCYEAESPDCDAEEADSFLTARRFFAPIAPGDVNAIGNRLQEMFGVEVETTTTE